MCYNKNTIIKRSVSSHDHRRMHPAAGQLPPFSGNPHPPGGHPPGGGPGPVFPQLEEHPARALRRRGRSRAEGAHRQGVHPRPGLQHQDHQPGRRSGGGHLHSRPVRPGRRPPDGGPGCRMGDVRRRHRRPDLLPGGPGAGHRHLHPGHFRRGRRRAAAGAGGPAGRLPHRHGLS